MLDIDNMVLNGDVVGLISRRSKYIKTLSGRENMVSKKIAILGGSSTQELRSFLHLFLLNRGINPEFYESEFGKFFEESVFSSEMLDAFKPDVIYIFICEHNLIYHPWVTDGVQEVEGRLAEDTERIWDMLSSLRSRFPGAEIIVNNLPFPQTRVCGNLDGTYFAGFTNYVKNFNLELERLIQDFSNVYLHDLWYLSAKMGLDRYHDSDQWVLYRFAQSQAATAYIAHNLAAVIAGLYGRSKKVVVVDLDNTLWSGIIGDEGVEGVEVGGETPAGEPYADFQRYLGQLHDRGVVLTVCSKNDPDLALEGLNADKNVLHEDYFAVIKANWEPKDRNLAATAAELSLGEDSFVFVDDNPAERALVAQSRPCISIVGCNQVTDMLLALDKLAYFEPVRLTADDFKRNEMYKGNLLRKQAEAQYADYGSYLKSLKTVLYVGKIEAPQLPRCAQLISKTNQFNLTALRISEAQLRSCCSDGRHIAFYARARDRFGENGIISVLLASVQGSTAEIEIFLMSCRVLKRDIEFAIMNKFTACCKEMGLAEVKASYRRTERNAMVSTLYQDLGFIPTKQEGDTQFYTLKLTDYKDFPLSLEFEGQ